MADLSGQVIRGYELGERIGTGGFGAVYRAFQASVGREVAIKVILGPYANHPEFSRRFEVEAQLIARLEHLHIVPLIDFWREENGSAYLVMRWLRGGSLRSRIANGPLNLAETVRVVTQIGAALAVAHQQGIVHRDLKPGNILLDEHGNAYLTDFGIAKDLLLSAEITADGQTPSTPAYAAPEQVSGQAVTPQADIYSFGMTVYECLAGQHPFPGALLRHLRDPLPPLVEQHPDIPAEIDTVLLQATQKEPAARYAEVMSFVRAFREALQLPGEINVATEDTTLMQVQAEPQPTLVVITPPHVSPPATGTTVQSPAEQSAILIETLEDVPSRPDKLIGRAAMLDEIQVALERNKRVLLQGFGGMGKTVLAAEMAASYITRHRRPVLWLHAGNEATTTLLEALVRPFDAHQQIINTKKDLQTQATRRILAERQVKLVVLDDLWDSKALKQLLNAVPRDVPVLATSRQRYPLDRIIDVGELEADKAIELLNHYARTADTSSEAAELCQRLGYHPFALEIAGKLLQVDELNPAELLQRIIDAPHTIAMPQGFAEEGRETIQQLLDASVRALDDHTREVFSVFGRLFAPSATPELVALCLKQEPKRALEGLTALARRGLAKRVRLPRGNVEHYRIHALAHSYTRVITAISPQALIEGCRAYVLQFKAHLDALDAERANILKAAESAYQIGQYDSLLAIMRTLTVDGPYLGARGHDSWLLQQLDYAIEAARKLEPVPEELLHHLLSKRGNTYYERGELNQALEHYQDALKLAQKLKLTEREVTLLGVMSKVFSDQGKFAEAEARLAEAHKIAASTQSDLLLARVLEHQGYHFAEGKRDFKAARDVYSQQVALAERLNDMERLFFALQNLGAAEFELGEPALALTHVERSYNLARAEDNRLKMAHALYPMGAIYHAMNQRVKAQQCLNEALMLYRHSGSTARANELIDYMKQLNYPVQSD